MSVKKGDRFTWPTDDGDGGEKAVQIFVIRVGKDGAWADIHCHDGSRFWSKRQPLPLPSSFRKVES